MQNLMHNHKIKRVGFGRQRIDIALPKLDALEPGPFEVGPRNSQHGVA